MTDFTAQEIEEEFNGPYYVMGATWGIKATTSGSCWSIESEIADAIDKISMFRMDTLDWWEIVNKNMIPVASSEWDHPLVDPDENVILSDMRCYVEAIPIEDEPDAYRVMLNGDAETAQIALSFDDAIDMAENMAATQEGIA